MDLKNKKKVERIRQIKGLARELNISITPFPTI